MTNSDLVEKKLLLAFTVSSSSESETDEERMTTVISNDMFINRKRMLSKQLSMKETTREAKWEHRRRQVLDRKKRVMATEDQDLVVLDEEEEERRGKGKMRSLTDEDFDELRGSIDLGFGFNEEDGGYDLCDTLPALDLYFKVNRQLSEPKLQSSPSPTSTPTVETPSPRSPEEEQRNSVDWKICNPGKFYITDCFITQDKPNNSIPGP